ncbi:MAG TPA: hypothetical protein VJN64_09125 [Terriglobales bacterium]|nr:hypothetical protein [Terriglobales bacterium]
MPLFALLLAVLVSFGPSPAPTGLKIVTRQVTGGFADVRTEYLTPDKLRNEWQPRTGDTQGPPMASIIQRGEPNRVYVLDLQAHEYMMLQNGWRDSASGSQRVQPVRSGGTLDISIENIDTGERKQMFGHTARHIITKEKRVAGPGACSRDSESETDGWYIDPSIMPEWHRSKSPGIVVASVMSAGNDNCRNKTDAIQVHRTGVDTGFPVQVHTTLHSEIVRGDGLQQPITSTWGVEVLELKEGPLDPALFEVPADFRRVNQLRSWMASAAPHRPLSGWEWLKAKLEEWLK